MSNCPLCDTQLVAVWEAFKGLYKECPKCKMFTVEVAHD